MKRSQAPGSALLHRITLTALCLLALNDHVLKRVCPGLLTGKLSDFAGVVLLPLFVHALLELLAARVFRRPFSAARGDRWLLGCIVVSLLAFGLPEVWPPAELAYRYGLGAARWPFQALAAVASGHGVPHLRPVQATADVTDLLALPMGWVAYWVGRRSPAKRRRGRALGVAASLFLLLLLPSRPAAAASKPLTHDGFYLDLQVGSGGVWVDSSGSVSNGFRQEIPSKASAPVAPATALTLGGTFAKLGLVLGGRLAVSSGVRPVVETLGTRFNVPGQHLLVLEMSAVALYYPKLSGGLHFGAALGPCFLGVPDSGEGAAPGFSGSLEVGHGFFLARQWSLGATLRFTAARTYSHADVDVASTLLMPTLLATVTLH